MSQPHTGERGWRFWMIFLAICSSTFLAALDLASVSTMVPSIIHDLGGTDSFAWISAGYTISCTAILPFSGKLADTFGRRLSILAALLFFAGGSAICGAAVSLDMFIAGRVVQGVGSGGIQSLTAIIISDLVTLDERGLFIAITGAAYSLATAVGPFLGGALAQKASWRWLFYLNLPLCVMAMTIVLLFVRLKKPPSQGLWKDILALDWCGNILMISSTIMCIITLTWAGVRFPWSSAQILPLLIVGLCTLVAALVYEIRFAKSPTVSLKLFSTRTGLSGHVIPPTPCKTSFDLYKRYIGTFLHGGVTIAVIFYIPVYFQASKLASPLLSGIYFSPLSIAASPAAVAQGIIISKTGRYRLVNIIGWCLMLLGCGLLSLLRVETPIGISIPIQISIALGTGLLYATQFSILAPLPPQLNAQALSFLIFLRSFSQSWGVAIGATIIQNHLRSHLPAAFLERFSPTADLTYTAIPLIPKLTDPLLTEVREAYAGSLSVLWKASAVVCAFGLLSALFQKNIPLHQKKDDRWGIEEKTVVVADGPVPEVAEVPKKSSTPDISEA